MARWRTRASGIVAELPDGVDPGAAWERLDPVDAPKPAEPAAPAPTPEAPEPELADAAEEEEDQPEETAPEPTAAELRQKLSERGLRWRRGWTKADAMAALEAGAADGN